MTTGMKGLVLAFGASLTLISCNADVKTNDTAMDTTAASSTVGSTTSDTGIGSTSTNTTDSSASMNNGNSAMPAMSDANIFAKLDAANTAEVEEGKLAQQKAKSSEVKSFGKMLVDDHGTMKSKGAALAKSLGITPEPMAGDTTKLEAEHTLAMLRSMSGAAFDSAFVAHEVEGHQKTLSALQMMQGQAKSDSLRTMINEAIPKVQMHLDHARSMQSSTVAGR